MGSRGNSGGAGGRVSEGRGGGRKGKLGGGLGSEVFTPLSPPSIQATRLSYHLHSNVTTEYPRRYCILAPNPAAILSRNARVRLFFISPFHFYRPVHWFPPTQKETIY
jgi:hypothetical protein